MYWDKMSKSKLNGIDPTDVVEKYGMDTIRITMLTNVGPHRSRKWSEQDGKYIDNSVTGPVWKDVIVLFFEIFTKIPYSRG